jgi:hypothetical protein
MTNLNGSVVFNTVIGVFDHNTIYSQGATNLVFLDSYWNNDSSGRGDQSCAAPTNFGSSQFLFLEDNTYTGTATKPVFMTDAYAGARFVLRHNQIVFAKVSTHGTDSSGRFRGFRAAEIYRNIFSAPTTPNSNGFGQCRSGIVLMHDNSFSGWSPTGYGPPSYSLAAYRIREPFVMWGGADGTNVWDVNRAGGPFYTGTVAGPNVGLTVTVSGSPNWTTNQWVSYTIRRTTNLCASNSLIFAEILSNTSNTITYSGNTGDPHSPPSLNFCAADSLEIRKVDQIIDQPGRARGSLITGYPPVPPAGWNDQVTEPCYSWSNLDEHGGHMYFSGSLPVRAGEHYFNDTPMPGYTEYVYPHPLTTPLSLSPPTTPNATPSSPHNFHKKRYRGRRQS